MYTSTALHITCHGFGYVASSGAGYKL